MFKRTHSTQGRWPAISGPFLRDLFSKIRRPGRELIGKPDFTRRDPAGQRSLSLLYHCVEYGRRMPGGTRWEISSRGGRAPWGEVQTALLASCDPPPAVGRDRGGRWLRLCRAPRRPGLSPAQRILSNRRCDLSCGRSPFPASHGPGISPWTTEHRRHCLSPTGFLFSTRAGAYGVLLSPCSLSVRCSGPGGPPELALGRFQ